jgi:hypothetical protein
MPTLTLSPTEQFFMAGDVMVRLWQGTDQNNLPVIALIAGVMAPEHAAAGLTEIPPPTPQEQQEWARKILEP